MIALADLTFSGMDELIKTMASADIFDDATQTKLLLAGAEQLRSTIREEGSRSGQDVSRMLSKLQKPRKPKTDEDGNKYLTIGVTGKNSRGERNATVLFVLNYGRSEPYGKIHGSYFWTRAVQRASRDVVPIYEKIINEELEERSLI